MDSLINKQARRGVRTFGIALAALILGVLISLKSGAVPVTWDELYHILVFGDTSKIGQIIMTIRMPRIAVGFLAGMNLALSGVILQGILRNPLADPGIIGITSGGALAAMIIMILFPSFVMLVPIGAFGGALLAAFLVYGISWQGGLNPLRLVLAGVAVAAFFGGFNTVLSVFFPDRVQGTVSWMAGGFVGRSWDDAAMIWPYTAVGIVGTALAVRWLTILSLGDDTARTLGLHVERCRLLLLVLAALLAASAVSLAQEPEILLLDEPTTYLDSRHQIELMDLVKRTQRERNITVIMVLHDLNLALRYSDRIVVIKDGMIAGDGAPGDMMTEENLAAWFGIKADILYSPRVGDDAPICVPYGIV